MKKKCVAFDAEYVLKEKCDNTCNVLMTLCDSEHGLTTRSQKLSLPPAAAAAAPQANVSDQAAVQTASRHPRRC